MQEQQEQEQEPYVPSKRRKIARWITTIILIYGFIGFTLYYFQQRFLFHPEPLPADYVYHFDVPFKEVSIALNSHDTLSLVQFLPGDSSFRKGIVLYFHGNMDNINYYAKYAKTFTDKGYEVWMPDYPGFGKSTGSITETLINKEATEVYKLAHSRFGEDSIIVYGKSLGTGPASYIASTQKCKRLILETPYYSIPSLFGSYAPIYPTDWMSRFKFPNGDYLKKVQEPITIFHGTSDRVVFYSNASKLKKVLKPGDEFVTIEDGGHNNLADFPQFREILNSLL